MVENPEIGGQYWFVTDIWERFCPVPVTIVAVNEEYGAFLVRWDIGESEYFEQYEGVWPNELYETQEGAAAECRRRNALPCGYVEKVVNYLEEFMSGPHHTLIYTSHSPEFEDFADIIYEIDDHKLVEHVKVR